MPNCRASRSSIEDRLGVVLLPGLLAIAWLVRHAVRIMNRYGIGRDGAHTSRARQGSTLPRRIVRTVEVVHGLVPASKEHKFEPRTSVGFRGASPRDSHLIFDDEVIEVRTVKRMPEERRWQAERGLRLDALPWLSRPPRVNERLAQPRRRYITWDHVRN